MDLNKSIIQKINLRKDMVDVIKQNVGLDGQQAEVVVAMDYSGSMSTLYRNGTVQDTFERLLPIGMSFDSDKKIDVMLFDTEVKPVKEVCTIENIIGFVNRNARGDMGGTNYAPTINYIVEKYATKPVKTGLLGGLFTKKSEIVKLKDPVYVIYITDGENDDKSDTIKALQNASQHGIFFKFIGIGNCSFNFLQKLDDLTGRVIDNADFVKLNDLSLDDNELYNKLMTEFPSFINEAKRLNIIG